MSDDTTTPVDETVTENIPSTQEEAWLVRAKSELEELRVRIGKLVAFLFKGEDMSREKLNLLKTQLSAMIAYEVALSNRIE